MTQVLYHEPEKKIAVNDHGLLVISHGARGYLVRFESLLHALQIWDEAADITPEMETDPNATLSGYWCSRAELRDAFRRAFGDLDGVAEFAEGPDGPLDLLSQLRDLIDERLSKKACCGSPPVRILEGSRRAMEGAGQP